MISNLNFDAKLEFFLGVKILRRGNKKGA